MNKQWFSSWVLGWIEMANALCRILTLGFYSPSFDFKYIFWISKRRITREINKQKIKPPFPGYKILKLLLFVIISYVIVQPARAWEPNWCNEKKDICYGPVLAIASLVSPDGQFQLEADLGPGWGVRFWADKPYSLGVDLFLFARAGGGEPNKLRMALAGSLFRILRLGYAVELNSDRGPRGLFVLGLGLDFKSP